MNTVIFVAAKISGGDPFEPTECCIGQLLASMTFQRFPCRSGEDTQSCESVGSNWISRFGQPSAMKTAPNKFRSPNVL